MFSDTRKSPEAVRLLGELIGFRSLSRQEGPLSDYLETYLSGRGMRVRRLHDNLYFSIGKGSDRLLLNSHLDVVPASVGHPFDAFTATFADGFIWGRGAVDAKASVAAMVAAVLQLSDEGWSPDGGQIVVALTTCEEMGGGYNGLEEVLPHLPPISAALIGEPTDLRPCTAQKGLLILNVLARGRSAHAARAALGDNAITKAAEDVLRLSDLRLDREDPLLGPVTVTPTLISGGTARNTVPDECSLTLDIRSTPAYTHAELVEIVREKLTSEVTIHSDRLNPTRTANDQRIVRAAVSVTGEEPFGSPTMSDWIFVEGTPAVKIGPGTSDLSHSAEERIRPEEVVRATEIYRNIMVQYFSGDMRAIGSI